MIVQAAVFLLASLELAKGSMMFSHEFRSTPQSTRRRLTEGSSGEQSSPYEGLGLHFLPMYFGNPAQLRTVAVSTAGDFTALPCDDCTDCGTRGVNLYNITKSQRSSTVPCDQCTEGASCFDDRCRIGRSLPDLSTWSGYEVSDVAYHGAGATDLIGTDVAEALGFPLHFVCQTRTRGFFNYVIDGVLGMSPAPTSFLSQMHSAGKLEFPRFSLCFNDPVFARSDAGTGLVTFGGYRQSLVETEMVYAKMLEGNAYKVNIQRLHLRLGGGHSIIPAFAQDTLIVQPPAHSDISAIVDSSSPYLSFDQRFEQPFRAAWKEATGKDFTEARQELTVAQLELLPTILVELEGDPNTPRELDPNNVPSLTSNFNVLVAVPSRHYMEHMDTDVRPFRARIQFKGEAGSIIGANLMEGHTVSYEPDRNRIGFAESRICQANTQGADDGDGTTSVSTSSGSTESSITGTTDVGTDDMFESLAERYSGGDDDNSDGGGCFSATCRSFMAIGYVFIGVTLAVAYRLSRPKERGIVKALEYNPTVDGSAPYEDASSARRRKMNEESLLV